MVELGRMKPLLALVGVVILLAALKAATSVIVPLLLALMLAIAFAPISDWIVRRGWPHYFTAILTITGVLLFVAGIGWLVWAAGADLAESVPRYEKALVALRNDAAVWFTEHGMRRAATSLRATDPTTVIGTAVTSGLMSAGGFVSTGIMVLIITAFIQLEATTYRRKLLLVLGSPRPVRKTVAALKDVQKYMMVKVILGAMNGVFLGLWCALWGIPNPLLWGVVAFALNFIPIIGSLIAAIPPVVLGLMQHGVVGALGVAAGYVLVNLVVDSILEPRITGRTVGLSPLVVLLAMLIWGFVLGPVGALLSVPLTMAVKVLLAHSEDLQWLATLLGDPADLQPTAAPPATPTVS
jgi:AI-2 transport protein TqsA